MIDRDLLLRIVEDARFSPTVHNVQPTHYRREADGTVTLIQAPGRTLPVGDPTGRDVAASHGAAAEGFVLAAGLLGYAVAVEPVGQGLARLALTPGAGPDPLAQGLKSRRTWRGRFGPAGETGRAALAGLAALAPDLALVTGPEDIVRIARLNDEASLRAFRDTGFRGELLSWMRLSRRHPRWSVDGLNAEAMEMSPLEAAGAGIALRPGIFEALDRIGLAGALTGEAATVRTAAAIGLFHRPASEPPFETGRRWHRLWLEMERLGLSAAPMTVLGDDAAASAALAGDYGLPAGDRLVTAFRIGPTPPRRPPPARRAASDLVTDA